MTKIDLLSKLDQTDEIFALPQTLMQVLQAVESEDYSARTMAEVIARDPSLTGKILKMANSSYYRRGPQISTVDRAIVVLGISMVRCLALSVSVFVPPKELRQITHFDLGLLYSHFLGTGIAAQLLAEVTKGAVPEEAFSAGLLHDLGELFILKVQPLQYAEMLVKYGHGQGLVEKEREVYGTDHAELGFLIARKWHLPSILQSAIANHHRVLHSSEPPAKLDLIVALADVINGRAFAERSEELEAQILQTEALVEALGASRSALEEINAKILNETYKFASQLGIDIGDPLTLLEKANRQILRSYVTIETLFKERQDLSKKILEEEHKLGAMESKNIAVATLSHYVNNAATVISGRLQLINMLFRNRQITDPQGKLEPALVAIEEALSKILAVLDELKSIASLDDVKFHAQSSTLNIDENIQQRMRQMKTVMS